MLGTERSQNAGFTYHPNRVYIKELPPNLDSDELIRSFSSFGFRIRTARVVETQGSTNYGFLTFESREEADQILQAARSEQGILIRGKKATVDRAYSRKYTQRRDSRQLSLGLQRLVNSTASSNDSHVNPQSNFMQQNYNNPHELGGPSEQHSDSFTAQVSYHMQAAQPYSDLYFDGQPVYLQQEAPGFAQNISGRPPSAHDEFRGPHQWSVHGAQNHAYESVENTYPRHAQMHAPYFTMAHREGSSSPSYAEDPAEGAEAPLMPERSSFAEPASVHRIESETPTATHVIISQGYAHPDYSQLHNQALHQLQSFHQDFAQQQSPINGHWVHHPYAHYHQPPQEIYQQARDPRGESNESDGQSPGSRAQ
ncbi:uncharacterized protein LOC100905356 [Galendromus occidentalis]|uniref:Uncharacterized protein LOC100905356 n=1 Tax=Galendromus occidentalis TaxID=34638 RepID=A0AAJ6W0U6_9ACAR|nr:uncharacterized protein LOC100905356 [Galendromus occidentalis]